MRVPTELVLDILDAFVAEDDAAPTQSRSLDALRTCSLVCRRWSLPAQKRLVSTRLRIYVLLRLFLTSSMTMMTTHELLNSKINSVPKCLLSSPDAWFGLWQAACYQKVPTTSVSSYRRVDNKSKSATSLSERTFIHFTRKLDVPGALAMSPPTRLARKFCSLFVTYSQHPHAQSEIWSTIS